MSSPHAVHHNRNLEVIQAGLMIVDAHGVIVFVDTNLRRLLGLNPELTTLEQQDLGRRLVFDNGQAFHETLQAAERQGQWTGTGSLIVEDRPPQLLKVQIILLKDASGARMGSLLQIQDVTRTQSMEKQMIHSQQMELVENLSIGLAHEFKNLLTVIMAYASLLQDQMQGNPLAKDAGKILEAAHRANDLTTRLLSVTRRAAPKMESVSLQMIITDVVGVLYKTLPKDIQLFAPEKKNLPLVFADQAILYRAILNLCMNARDAMPEGGTLTLEADTVEVEKADLERWPDRQPGTYITISVTDTGHGMDENIKKHLFETFFTTKPAGTGLGLSVVQHTIKAMNGWIGVYSEPGLGACFRLYIPVAKEEAEKKKIVDEAGETAVAMGTEHILVVDDDPLSLSIAQRFLERSGYRVTLAGGGEEAIKLFTKTPRQFELVLLDVVMPHVSGEEVYQEITRLRPDAPVLLTSGFPMKTAERIIKVSHLPFISKPFTRSRLALEVRNVLDRHKTGPT